MNKIRLICFNAIFAALLVTVQTALSALPNIEGVSLCVLAAGMVFGWKFLPGVIVFAFAEGMLYGFHWWTIAYFYVWPVLLGLGILFSSEKSALGPALISALFGLLFGSLCALVMIFPLGLSGAISWIIAGIGFDLVHAAGNFIITLLLIKPLKSLFQILKRRYTM